jgi:hypothetical protein
MPNITNPQAVNFCNDKARVLADCLVAAKRTADQFMIEVVRDYESQTASNVAADQIIDGSLVDGRQRVVHSNVAELKAVVTSFLAAMNAANVMTNTNKWAVNGRPLY